jgi:hypothetical protein
MQSIRQCLKGDWLKMMEIFYHWHKKRSELFPSQPSMPRKPIARQRNEIRHQCDKCDCSYTRPDKLSKHKDKHHPKAVEPDASSLRPLHPSQMHFTCEEPDCLLGQLISSMISFECDHAKQRRLLQLQEWMDYIRSNNQQSQSLLLDE